MDECVIWVAGDQPRPIPGESLRSSPATQIFYSYAAKPYPDSFSQIGVGEESLLGCPG